MAAVLSPSLVVAIALAVFGIGLVAAAFVGDAFGVSRLVLGFVFITAGLITAGAGALLHHSAPAQEDA